MSKINSISFALEPSNVPSFLLDWEVTKLCNLDCTYCFTGLRGGHDNTTKHPSLEECLKTIDFMYEYVSKYMKYLKPSHRKVVLNVYGGESLFHPNIIEILEACRTKYEDYKNLWHLTVICTTNGIVGKKQWARIVPLIDEFSVSYHAECLPKQHQQYKDNVLYLKEHKRRFKCVVMMHNDAELFKKSEELLMFCKDNELRYVAKPLDNPEDQWKYSKEQFKTLKTFWINRVSSLNRTEYSNSMNDVGSDCKVSSISEGRPCCGGRHLSLNGDLKSNVSFVPAQGFKGWHCSVNWFFLFVRQVDGAVFTNKDCETSTSGRVEPLGYLNNAEHILDTLNTQLETKTMPIIQCVKETCRCGFCAPKAQQKSDFDNLIGRHIINNPFTIN